MKKLFVSISVMCMFISLAYKHRFDPMASNSINNVNAFKKPSKPGSWGPWRTTSCYRGLDFRVRRAQEDSFNGEKYEWEVQFKNRYEDAVNFNFKITYPGDESEPAGRMSLNANATSNGEDWGLVQASQSCEISVAKVRFGDDDGSKPYIPCGN